MAREADAPEASVVGEVAAEVAAAKGDEPLAPVTVVAPTVYAALALRRALGARARTGAHRGVANVECTVVDKLVRMLAAPGLAAHDLRVAPRPVDQEALRLCATAAPGWLADLVGHPRGLAAVRQACTELRRCPPATLAGLARRPGRGGELAGLAMAAGSLLRAHGFADEAEVARLALAGAGDGPGSVRGLGPLVCTPLGDVPPSHRLVLAAAGAAVGMRTVSDPGRPATCSEVLDCPDPDAEVRAATRSVLRSAERGVPLWRQAVLHPGGTGYARMVHQEMASAGVTTNGPERRRLHRSVAGTALVGLLELATSEWERDAVMAWLATAPIIGGPGTGPVPASRWDLVSAEAGVVRGAAQWAERLGLLAARRRQPEGGAPAPGAGNGPVPAPGSREEAAMALGSFVARLVEGAAPSGSSWSAHARWAVGLLDRYLDGEDDAWPDHERAAMAQVRGSVLALAELDRMSGGTDLGAFRRAVRAVLEETPLDTTELPLGGFGDGVFVASFPRARGLRFDTVTLLGMADAVVPGSIGEDALLPEEIRRLDESGGLRPRTARLEAMRDDVGAALAAGARRRVATWPRVDQRTGREHVRSRLLDELSTATTRLRSVASFAADVAGADPALSARELELHDLARWAAEGRPPQRSPVVSSSRRLSLGLGAARARMGATFTRFDGNVGDGRVSPFAAGAAMSATRLEAYAKCPRRFLYDRVLEVRRRVLPEELWQMEPAERGTLVHGILEAYLLERLAGARRSLERLLAVAEEHFAAAERTGLVGKSLLWRMDRDAVRRELRRFHEEEGDLEPLAAELAFGDGPDTSVPAVVVELDDGRRVRFKGRADRVDRAPGGALVVSDYKTGRQTVLGDLRKDPVAGGRLLQLPVYGLAARSRFGGGPVLARYWLLSEQRSVPCYTLELTEPVQARFREVLGLIADAVEAGAFPGAPTEKQGERQFDACRICDFDPVCPGTRDREWARKSADPAVAPVVALMNTSVPDDVAGAVAGRFPGT